jgi:hypothetical protein
MNETLAKISLPGTGAFARLSTIPAVSELHRHRQAQEVIMGSCPVRNPQPSSMWSEKK